MIVLHARAVGGKWYGIAYAGDGLVATAVSASRAKTLADLRRALPEGRRHRVEDEDRSDFAEKTITLLVELEAGQEEHKSFSLADCVSEPLASVLKVAAAIPAGYVTSYGNIAKASGLDARDVGQVMATNPLYPIVPCHRVVGADLSLVGYFGSKAAEALQAKLDRLSKEARGFEAEQDVQVEGRALRVYPVEWAIARARKHGRDDDRQLSLFD
jgi:methylated-DNA-[protein]-cysteine S-methyltransferase